MTHVVLGKGQIAEAITFNLKGDYFMFDKGQWEDGTHIKSCIFLHICIPYSDMFNDIVKNAIKVFNPESTIIHSTVKPGTSRTLKCSYSPVMGRHSDQFQKNITLYKKFIAGSEVTFSDFEDCTDIAIEYWGEDTDSLEFAKSNSTNYMYMNLVIQKIIYNECKKRGYDFKKVYTDWNINYNNGIQVKHKDWQRPVYDYDPDHKAGGHCLPNNIYLNDDWISIFLREWQETGQVTILPKVGRK
jgi:hypothetical protein